MNIELVNVVAGGSLGVSFDLYILSSSLSQYTPSYEPEISSGLHFELPDTAVTVMIFGSGKYHLTGGNSIEQMYEANEEFFNIIESDMDVEANPSKLEIRNLVYRGDFGREFDLEELANDITACDYDPEKYPGTYYSRGGAQMAVYRTGKFTVTGATDQHEVEDLVEMFRAELMG